MKFIEMKSKDIKSLKEKLWLKNNKKCPLLEIDVKLDKMALDHIHKLVAEPYSEQKGTIRDAIEFRANALEGKITNNWQRYFGADKSKHPISLPNYLRNLADYLEKGAYSEDETFFVHPNEVPKPKKVSKRNYNKLKKLYLNELKEGNVRKKFPEYPKSSKLTKDLGILFKKYCLEPYN
jgi:hypothetical protein